jgi:hypothetical protein
MACIQDAPSVASFLKQAEVPCNMHDSWWTWSVQEFDCEGVSEMMRGYSLSWTCFWHFLARLSYRTPTSSAQHHTASRQTQASPAHTVSHCMVTYQHARARERRPKGDPEPGDLTHEQKISMHSSGAPWQHIWHTKVARALAATQCLRPGPTTEQALCSNGQPRDPTCRGSTAG